MIQNITEFSKLYKINIPYEKEFWYYIQTLAKSPEYSDIYEKIEMFRDLEKEHSSAKRYKLDLVDEMSDYIKGTKAFDKLQSIDFSVFPKTENINLLNSSLNYNLLSIDIKSANFTCMKWLDDENELCTTWDELCDKFNVHRALRASKSFRQIVFGKTNGTRLNKLQHLKIMDIVKFLNENDFTFPNIVFISPDEIRLNISNYTNAEITLKCKIVEKFPDIDLKYKTLRMVPLGRKGRYIEHCSDFSRLYGIPANEYFSYFKPHVLREEIEDRDLYFVNDGKLAKWVV